jgi:hypothetical protein
MASTTFSVLTPTLAGTTVTAKGSVGSAETVTIAPVATTQGALDFRTLFVRVANGNSTVAVTLSLSAGANYNSIGIGAASISLATAATKIIGGQGFEGSRFLNSSGNIVFTQTTGTGPTSWEAYQAPRALE